MMRFYRVQNYPKNEIFYDFGDIEISPPHNDKLALVGILNTLPFAKKELRISWSVSQKFKDACNTHI